MVVTIDNKRIEIKESKRVIDLIDNSNLKYFGCRINQKMSSLTDYVKDNDVVKLINLTNYDGIRIYKASLRYLAAMACKNVLPKAKITFSYSVSRTIFASVSNLGHAFTPETYNLIKNEMQRLVDENLPINHIKMSKEDVISYYEKCNFYERIALLKRDNSEILDMYECDGYLNYMYSSLVPSTGYLKKFELRHYLPGFLISYPRIECNGDLAPFVDERAFRAALQEENRWVNTIKSESIAKMNEIIDGGRALELVNLSETRHNSQFTHLGDKIFDHIDEIKVICVAGPSSSGKTTFTNRLMIELKTRGIEPFMISMDDFYKNGDYPLDEEGKPDFEHLNALNLDLFDEVISKLVSGEEVKLPKFDFAKRATYYTDPVKISKNQPILIEGLHGLDPNILPSIPDEQKYRIYIAPLGQFRFDIHNPISISDLRLIRRMVRDKEYRATDIERTLSTWHSVRTGEFKWIYPYQNNADFVFNSELSYEIPVLKKHIVPHLEKIPVTSENYDKAKRLLDLLKYYSEISDKWVPGNSILREFIGESIFYTKDKK